MDGIGGLFRVGLGLWSFFEFIFTLLLLFTIHGLKILSMLNQSELNEVYKMVDSVPFSRVKKNISRDFSDALMMA